MHIARAGTSNEVVKKSAPKRQRQMKERNIVLLGVELF